MALEPADTVNEPGQGSQNDEEDNWWEDEDDTPNDHFVYGPVWQF